MHFLPRVHVSLPPVFIIVYHTCQHCLTLEGYRSFFFFYVGTLKTWGKCSCQEKRENFHSQELNAQPLYSKWMLTSHHLVIYDYLGPFHLLFLIIFHMHLFSPWQSIHAHVYVGPACMRGIGPENLIQLTDTMVDPLVWYQIA